MTLRFATYDVFTDARFAGNPLGVVFDADALSDAQMQTIAREFNLSETVFVRAPADARHTAAVRIFTPAQELPFAGHPTIGCAVALAEAGRAGEAEDAIIVLEEKIGPVRCAVERKPGQATFAAFAVPKLAEQVAPDPAIDAAAQAFGLSGADIGFGAHMPSVFSAGVTYTMVPLGSLDALSRAKPAANVAQLIGRDGAFLYARAGREASHAFRARMFAPEIGIVEDPATGSAAAAFAGVLARFEDLPDGWHTLPVLQGVEMGRPSLIGLEVHIENAKLAGARIAGKAVKVMEGTLSL